MFIPGPNYRLQPTQCRSLPFPKVRYSSACLFLEDIAKSCAKIVLYTEGLTRDQVLTDEVAHFSDTGDTMAYRPNRSRIFRHSLAAIGACAVLLSGCNLGCWFVPCDGALDVGVLVKNPSGDPIPGVHVAVVGYSAETDTNGCVKIEGIVHPASIFRDPEVAVSAERAGYKPLSEHRHFGVYRIEITLQPADSTKPSAAVWSPTTSRAATACS